MTTKEKLKEVINKSLEPILENISHQLDAKFLNCMFDANDDIKKRLSEQGINIDLKVTKVCFDLTVNEVTA